MKNYTLIFADINIRAVISEFIVEGGVSEYNVMIHCTDADMSYQHQLSGVDTALTRVLQQLPDDSAVVFKRYFLSDPANQAADINTDCQCAVSVIGQAPLDGTKVAQWAYIQTGMTVSRRKSGMSVATHSEYRHLWCGSACAPDLHSELATMALFGDYTIKLGHEGCELLDNCMRTWFFVRDIDVNYRGVVIGRNDVFRRSGLTPLTHFIASTGINGINADPKVSVTMDAYAVDGISSTQVHYLSASDNLNPTVEYGVAFERGTAIEYGDRQHVLISGTASINNRGEVMYPGDIRRQTQRVLDNIQALLNEAGCDLDDMVHLIVYLRDTADYHIVETLMRQRYGDMPMVIVHAAVCRPGWLIEMECLAIKARTNPALPPL